MIFYRNFVREDRRRRGNNQPHQPTRDVNDLEQKLFEAVQSLDSKGHKITLKKSQADLLQRLQQQKGLNKTNTALLDHNIASGDNQLFLSSTREGVVQSRLIRFTGRSSPTNSLSDGLLESDSLLSPSNGVTESDFNPKRHIISDTSSISVVNNNEKIVFGISPKSSSLSR